ncbi:aminotransferase class IV [Rhodovibrionaceae bacterium A322]
MTPKYCESFDMKNLPKISARHQDSRTYPRGVAYMDGQYLPIQEAKISVLDYGFLHSDATYDVVHVWQGAFFRLETHLDRFFRGMEKLHMSIPYDRDQIREVLHNCVALSGLREAYVEFICVRGTSPDFSRDPRDADNRFIAFSIPLGSIATPAQMARGLHLAITDVVRIPPASVDSTVKNYHWLDMVKGLYEAYEKKADSAVLRDIKGGIAEGPGFNVFAVKDGEVSTPDRGVLLGVTRQTIFDLCQQLALPCRARDCTADDLLSADEVFITSTAGGVMPVTRIDDQAVGSGEVGPITGQITQAYWQLHKEDRYRDPVDYPNEETGGA